MFSQLELYQFLSVFFSFAFFCVLLCVIVYPVSWAALPDFNKWIATTRPIAVFCSDCMRPGHSSYSSVLAHFVDFHGAVVASAPGE